MRSRTVGRRLVQLAGQCTGMAALLSALLLGLSPRWAGASIQQAVTIDGPSPEIVGFGGVAMASDGSGGVVYLKRVAGVAHVFVARYAHGKWLAPVEVDGEEPFAASDPRIGAASGGELLVVWATPFASVNEKPIYRLLSSTLDPGSPAFGPPTVVDRNIGSGDEVSPDLAMSPSGAADVVYRVVKQNQGEGTGIPLLRPSDVIEEVRVARYLGQRWVDLGEINHDRGVSMRAPTNANAPQIAITGNGNGVVVWQEPEVTGVARIWARRVIGSSVEYAMPVSATSFDGAPIGFDADAPSVAISRLGQADVAYRQLSGPGSPLSGARIFLGVLPDGESESGAAFRGATLIDPQVASGDEATTVGRPSVAIDEARTTRLLYDQAGSPRLLEGGNIVLPNALLELGPSFVGSQLASASELAPVITIDPAGGGVSAWPSADANGDPAVAIREDFPSGAAQTALASGSAGGPIGELGAGQSGLGDGLIAFQQGPIGDASIVGAGVSAPPSSFVFSVPSGWIEPSHARVEWTEAPSANGPLAYTVVLDGHRLTASPGTLEMTLPANRLLDGVHRVQMLVVDASGQSTLTAPEWLHIGPPPPSVTVVPADRGRGVTVHVSDRRSPVLPESVTIRFGDGRQVSGRTLATHLYARSGRYTLRVHAQSRSGQSVSLSWVVRVR